MKKSRILSLTLSAAMAASCFSGVSCVSADELSAEGKVYDFTAMTEVPVYSAEKGFGFESVTSSYASKVTDSDADATEGHGRTVADVSSITIVADGAQVTESAGEYLYYKNGSNYNYGGLVFRADVPAGIYEIKVSGTDATSKSNTYIAPSGMQSSRLESTSPWDSAKLVGRQTSAKWDGSAWSYVYASGEDFIEIEIEPMQLATEAAPQTVGVKSISITPYTKAESADTKPTVYVLGDSTQKTYTFEENSMSGYGQILAGMFNLDKVNVKNYSMGGRSMKANYQEGRFDDILASSKAGDYVLIHSAHNDESTGDSAGPAARFGRGSNAETYTNWLHKIYIPALKAQGLIPVLVTSMPRTSGGVAKETFTPDAPGIMRAVAAADSSVKLVELFNGAKAYLEAIGAAETIAIYQSLEAGETAGKTNSGSYANGHPDNKIDGTHYKEAYAKQLARIIVQDIYSQSSADSDMAKLADALADNVKAACADGNWTEHVFPEMANDISTIGNTSAAAVSQGNNAYYRNQIEKVLQLGVMAKDENGNFNPNSEMTVGQFANAMTQLWGLEESTLSDYTSVIEPAESEAPAVSESPAVSEAPVVSESPAVSEAPVVSESPAVSEAPTVSESPSIPPVEEKDAVKITAVYDGEGRLTSAKLDTNYKYNGTVEPVEGAKVFVWDNMTNMRPLCETTEASLSAELAADGVTVKYAVADGDAITAGQTVELDGITMTYGNDTFTVKAATNVEGYTAYVSGAGNPKDETGGYAPTTGCYYIFNPAEKGELSVAVVLNANKNFYVVEDGTPLDAYNGMTEAAKYYGKYSFRVEAGKTYYVYCTGSKLGLFGFEFTPGEPAATPEPTPEPTPDPNATPEPEMVERTPISSDAALTREAMAAILYDAYLAKFGKNTDGSWVKPKYMTAYNGTNLSPDDPNYDPNLTGASAQYYPLVGWSALTDTNEFNTSLYAKAKEVYNLGLMRSEKGIERGKMVCGVEMEPKTVVTRAKAAKELYFLYALIQDVNTENQVIPNNENMAFTKSETLVTPNPDAASYPAGSGSATPSTPAPTPEASLAPGELPADEKWTTLDAELLAAATGAADGGAFGPVNGLSGYGNWVNHSASAEYTHTDGTKYSFTCGFQAGSGNQTRRSFYFTPKQACIVTVAYAAQAGRPVYIYQNGKLLASGEEGLTNGQAAVITADVEDISLGDVYVYGGSSNKDIFGIFADYYDPSVIVYRTVSGKVNYSGAADQSKLKIVFKDTKDDTEYKADFAEQYSINLRQNRSYNVYIEEDGVKSDSVSTTINTNAISIAKQDKTFDIDVVDIALTEVKGEVVVHDIVNDGTTLDLSQVQLTFTANDDASLVYTTGVTDNKISVSMMPNHEYTVTASGNDGYEMSALSGTYLMAAGDTNPFKNILFTETLDAVEYSATINVGANRTYATINDAITAVKKMTRENGENGRVTILIDPGVYTEQVMVDANYVTLKAADENNRPELQWYYGIGYLYYSSAGNQYYSEDWAVQKTKKGTVTRWGAACRITGQYCNLENLIIRHTFNCDVTEAELADGVEPALHNEYSDTNGKPDRTVAGYDAKAQAATERAAAIALDGGYTEIYKCDFISSQDTFYTNNTAYVKDSYIEGGTDFIYGGNSVVFDGCTLAWHGYSDGEKGGYLTANKNGANPVAGTPDLTANGYIFNNCTITNSKYYPDNKFAAGSWGRNWGGAQTQVVFLNTKLDGVNTPGAWVKMGGELSASILYVDGVTDKDGNTVDTSSTTFNPNGTMAANGYTPMAFTDYFGLWLPPHYDGVVPEKAEYTSTWYFGKSNGAAEYAIEGAASTPVEITAVSDAPEAQVLTVDATAGKFNNAARTDQWAQVNDGTKFAIPVKDGSKITYGAYNAAGIMKIGDVSFTAGEIYTYSGTDTTVTAEVSGVDYMSYITAVTPAK